MKGVVQDREATEAGVQEQDRRLEEKWGSLWLWQAPGMLWN
jgi:hypothetical protein